MTGVTLAPAGPAHARILAALHAACFAASWDAKAMAELLPLPGLRATIALAGDEPVGLVLVRVAADEAEVLTICTLPAWRRRGIAGRLMEAAGDQATRAGAVRLYLEVAADDPAALGLYTARGFVVVGRRHGYYGHGRDALVMARSL